jgi:hypothetical protein
MQSEFHSCGLSVEALPGLKSRSQFETDLRFMRLQLFEATAPLGIGAVAIRQAGAFIRAFFMATAVVTEKCHSP